MNTKTVNNPDTGIDAPGPLSLDEAASKFGDILSETEDFGEQESRVSKKESTDDDQSSDDSYDLTDEEISAIEDESDGEEDQDNQDDDSDDAGDQDDDQLQPQMFKVKVDGQELEVTLDELRMGYSRHQDYTRKTQEVANLRKEVDTQLQAVQAERQQYLQRLQLIQQQFDQDPEPDWNTLRHEDPAEFAIQVADWQRKQQVKQQLAEQQNQVALQIQQQNQVALKQKRDEELAALAKVLPQWSDPEKGKQVKAMVLEQGKKLGFTEQELGNAYDHRAIVAMHKAALYDKLMERRQKLVPPAPKVAKPGGKGSPGVNQQRIKAQQRLKQTGDIRDAAAALLQMDID